MDVSNTIFVDGDNLKDITTYQVGAIESAAHRAIRQHKDSLLRDYDITGMDWYIIGLVSDSGKEGIRTTDLAEKLGTTMGFLTKAVNLLDAKKILRRTANVKDARSHYIVLNPSYRKTVDEIEAALRVKLRETVYSSVTPEELLTYVKVIEKFSRLG